jgi:hypothetical protein
MFWLHNFGLQVRFMATEKLFPSDLETEDIQGIAWVSLSFESPVSLIFGQVQSSSYLGVQITFIMETQRWRNICLTIDFRYCFHF